MGLQNKLHLFTDWNTEVEDISCAIYSVLSLVLHSANDKRHDVKTLNILPIEEKFMVTTLRYRQVITKPTNPKLIDLHSQQLHLQLVFENSCCWFLVRGETEVILMSVHWI